jgi:nucleotide-binding universal stress UspA family protein
MYKQVLVAVDNSTWSDHAVNLAIELARAGGGSLTGNHVYAARLHDLRFRQMEAGLPERYQDEEILNRQRSIHDSLIGRGLVIISDSYLDMVEARCREVGVPFTRQMPEGRNFLELLRSAEGGFDLVALGAYGLGKGKRTLVGSVCERVVRRLGVDTLVARQAVALTDAMILVAVDGSDCSFAAVRRAVALSKAFSARLKAVAVYDPFYHRVAFNSLAGVLSDEAAKVFRFREQEVLHDEIIDSGLMKLYQTHLDRAARLAAAEGVTMETMVLPGKPYDVLLDVVEEQKPALLIMGRVGFHHDGGPEIGSNTENVLRLAPCNLLVVSERPGESADEPAAPEAVAAPHWAAEAEARLERVPPFARSMARKGIEDYALERGVTTITADLVEEAKRRFGM